MVTGYTADRSPRAKIFGSTSATQFLHQQLRTWPDAPHLRLWHALTVLCEHGGDGHAAVLVDAELGGLEALVVHTATGRGFVPRFARASRGWSARGVGRDRRAARRGGILDGDGALTTAGATFRAEIEDRTSRLRHAPWAALGCRGRGPLGELGGGLARALVAAGCFPEGIMAAGR